MKNVIEHFSFEKNLLINEDQIQNDKLLKPLYNV